jgi:hypothetical protein
MNFFLLTVNAEGLGVGQNLDVFGYLKKFLIPEHVKAGFLELPRVTDITGYEIGNTAASIGNEVIPIHHNHSGIWLQPLEATSSFRSKRNSTDNDNIFCHA